MISATEARPHLFTLVQIPNSHSLGLKTVNSSVTEMEIAFAGSPE